MNNMPYPFMPDMNMMNPPYQFNNKIMELEERINQLNREVRRLEHRVNQLEKKNQPHISKTNVDDSDDSGIYMM